MPRIFTQKQGAHHGDIGQRQNECAQNGKRNRLGHGFKHLAFNANERQNWEINNQDDDFTKSSTASDFRRSLVHFVVHFSSAEFPFVADLQTMDNGFHNDHRSIHNQSKVDSAQTHQVAAHPKNIHHGDGKEQSQGNHGGNYQASAEITNQEHQNEYHD